jgi:hypothetical protein
MDERERAHLVAVTELAAGRWHSAGLRLEELAATWPHDELALMAAHQVDFMRGDSRMLRDRIARALPAWDAGRPGWHAMLGMYALAVHNTWHLALFHLTEGEPEQVLRLYDEGIGGPGSPAVIDLIDATAMLWRLRLLGIDVGNRWQPVAERWAAAGPLGGYAFNAVHALMAYIATGRSHEQQEVLEALVAASHADDDSAVFAREAGLPVARALLAKAAGDHRDACRHLRRVRNQLHRFGGSHAQRDLFDLILLDAVARAGETRLLAALMAERAAARPGRPIKPASVGRAQSARLHVPEDVAA